MKSPHFLLPLMMAASFSSPAAEPDWATLETQFRELPPAARRLTGPLFWLHGDESRERLEQYVGVIAEGGNGCFTAESRPHNDWLGPNWYRDLDICLQAAKKNDLEMWIFDERWWPSQMVGGRVPPEYGTKLLEMRASSVEPGTAVREFALPSSNLVAVLAGREVEGGAVDGGTLVDLTPRARDGTLAWDAPAGARWKVMVFTWRFAGAKGMQKQWISVDGASRDCVDWFLQFVYQPHADRFGADFGKTIRGFFYDEPETQGDWGSEVIPMLKERGADWKKALVAWKGELAGDDHAAARYQYRDAFAEAWGRTMYGGMSAWCRSNNVVSIGHFMEHNWDYMKPGLCAGNLFQLLKYSDMGGIDLVCRQFYPGQKPDAVWQMAKLGSSITHVNGLADDLTMCEIFGGYGQELTYPQMKWLTDQMQVRGVNFMIPHSFNPRAPYDSDYPPYFYNGGYEPRWPLYRVYADYTSRLSLLLRGGRHVCPVAFLFPGQSAHEGKWIKPEAFMTVLQDALYDADWMPYDLFEKDATLSGGEIELRQEQYRVLVVPGVELIPPATLEKARDFLEQGGIVIGYGLRPSKSATAGRPAADAVDLGRAIWGDAEPGLAACKVSAKGGRSYFLPEKPTSDDLQKVLRQDAGVPPVVEVLEGRTDDWVHALHRVKSGRDVFLICNQNTNDAARAFRFRVRAAGVPEVWDAMRNEMASVPYESRDGAVEFPLTLEAMESAVVVFQPEARPLPPRPSAEPPPEIVLTVARDTSAPATAAALPPVRGVQTTLRDCSWVWHPAGNPIQDAAPGPRFFRHTVVVPHGVSVVRASAALTADNSFTMWVNGEKTGDGEAWENITAVDFASRLKPGTNALAVAAVNGGDGPNPAGLIGRYEIVLSEGSPLSGRIDASWKVSDREADGWKTAGFDDREWPAARAIAKNGEKPWGRLGSGPRMTLSPIDKANPFVGSFELPAGTDPASVRAAVVMTGIAPEDAARVTVNGADAGGFIGKPRRLDITRHLKPGRNAIRIEPFAPAEVKVELRDRAP